ncbi:helix-turn-helix domain-containing protein [Dokdonia sp.]|uniref:helix-turn-helix domain-containing protein n=1 Tax=Dokdonia sp. TaxID=2024995 RepID=UPI003264B108
MFLSKILISIIILFVPNEIYGQLNKDINEDLSVSELISKYYDERNEEVRSIYGYKLIELGQLKIDTTVRITGHFLLAQLKLNQNGVGLAHSDSVIKLSSIKPNAYHPALAYMKKAEIYFEGKEFLKSFENYLAGQSYAKKYPNKDLLPEINYRIAILKNRVEDYEGAIDLFKKNIDSTSIEITNNNYLLSLFGLADANMHLHKIDSAVYYNVLGLERAQKTNNNMYNFFLMNEGYISFHTKNYNKTIEKLSRLDSFLIKQNDLINLSQSNFYQGRSYLFLNDTIKGLKKFKIVDSIFNIQNDLTPEIRSMYPILINYYNKAKKIDLELYYSKRLFRLDSIINSYNLNLAKRIYKNHDIPLVIEEKNNEIAQSEKRNQLSNKIISFTILILVLITSAFIYQYFKKKKIKARLDYLIENKSETILISNEDIKPKSYPNIGNDIIQKISNSLEEFEMNNGFLDSNITIQNLSKKIKTNPKYLSYVINNKRNLTFSSYINILRVEYAIDRLKRDKMFRNYTVKAIAAESGYNNPASFSNAFRKLTKVKPSLFIKELNKKS